MKAPRFQIRAPEVSVRADGFTVRTLRQSDADPRHLKWVADPELMSPLNMPARSLSLDELKQHIAGFDGRLRHLLGIYHEEPALLIGLVVMDLTPEHQSARFSLMIGDRAYWADSRVHPVARAFLAYVFERLDIEKIRAQVSVENLRMIGALKLMGLRSEGLLRGEIKSRLDGSRVDQFVFGLLKDDWMAERRRGK